jgi:glucose/arabinose dehydrogenase
MRRPKLSILAGLGLFLAAAWPASAALQLELELTGLDNLVDITHAGDGRLFLARQEGQILVWDGVSAPTTFLDITSLMGSGFEGGIKSLAFPPDYATTGFFFVHYSNTAGDNVLARYSRQSLNVADPASGVILITIDQTTTVHRGGQLGFDAEGMLLMALGDGGPQTDPDCHAQRQDFYQGKLLRFDIHQNVGVSPFYGIPADNPFIGAGGFADEVWAYGLRNPWRFSFDRHSGALWIADVGQVNREEINVEPRNFAGGRNYGWRVMEGNFCHDPDPVDADCPVGTPSCGSPLYTAPSFDYDHSGGRCSITGGFVYRGREHASLVGRYLYGDWCSGQIWANSPQQGWVPQLMSFNLVNMTTFGEDWRGNIFLSEGSNLYRISDPVAIFVDGFESGDTSAWQP